MNHTISLGQFILTLVPENDQCSPPYNSDVMMRNGYAKLPPLTYELFPFLLDYYFKGKEIAGQKISSKYPHSKKELVSKIENQILPNLKKVNSFENLHEALKEIYIAFPKCKDLINQLEDKFVNDPDPGIFALVWIPWVIAAVIVYAIGYYLGSN
jgi:hypothetical protein